MHIINEYGVCGRVRCSQLHGTRVVLLGDAAHAVTPVGGQGANAALQDCEVLDRVLAECGAPWGRFWQVLLCCRRRSGGGRH